MEKVWLEIRVRIMTRLMSEYLHDGQFYGLYSEGHAYLILKCRWLSDAVCIRSRDSLRERHLVRLV